jgi:hypothetical protein
VGAAVIFEMWCSKLQFGPVPVAVHSAALSLSYLPDKWLAWGGGGDGANESRVQLGKISFMLM